MYETGIKCILNIFPAQNFGPVQNILGPVEERSITLHQQEKLCRVVHFSITGGPHLVRFLEPGKNRTMRNSY
jgi:hypothetical protein